MAEKEKFLGLKPVRAYVIGGHARLPEDLTNERLVTVFAYVDTQTDVIISTAVQPFYGIADLLDDLLIGLNLNDAVSREGALAQIEARLYFRGKKAVLSAVKDLFREYRELSATVPAEKEPADASNPNG